MLLYALQCNTQKQENIFKDILQIPTLMLWDHGLLQLPQQDPGAASLYSGGSTGGSIRRLKKALDHPLYVHYSPDHGHIGELDRLGVMPATKSIFSCSPRIRITSATAIARLPPARSERKWRLPAMSTLRRRRSCHS